MRVRPNSLYQYQPAGFDVYQPAANNTLQAGQVVRVINLPGAPPANRMGQCYVARADTGRFVCMVSTGSLIPVRR